MAACTVRPDPEGPDEWVLLARSSNGSSRWAYGRGQSVATAVITAAAVDRSLTEPTWIHEIIALDDLRDTLRDNEITLGH
ncbi:hypothetical protein [Nocardia colli]|uniref:hypothetical protein n=1 Tax=Nocardia colli TaxID=2545717 RepID=UPI0035E073B0